MFAFVASGRLMPPDQEIFQGVNAYAAMGFGFELGVIGAVDVNAYAATNTKGDKSPVLRQTGYPHVLISFVYDKQRDFFTDRLGYWPDSILGDSGAFSVWTLGETVDLGEYTDWCLHYQELRPDFLAITLDVIPGKPDGSAPTKRDRTKAMNQGVANSDQLRESGVRIMEVFHWHEPMEQLELLLDRRRPGEVVGIGGLAGGGSIVAKRRFCDSVFAVVKEHVGGWEKLPPIHGLGISPDSPLAARYPWWSVDSSSWAAPAKFGRHVSKDGKRGGRDGRVSQTDVRRLYLGRVLEGWNRREQTLTKMWHERGVRFDVQGSR